MVKTIEIKKVKTEFGFTYKNGRKIFAKFQGKGDSGMVYANGCGFYVNETNADAYIIEMAKNKLNLFGFSDVEVVLV